MKIKDSDHYKTPNEILNQFIGYFDPCPYDINPKFDGLKIDWKDKNFVNPPYSNVTPWINKAIEENKKGKIIVLLLKLDCSTKWFKMLQNANAKIVFINYRLKFNGKSAPFCNALFILN